MIRTQIWKQWDRQEAKRIKTREQTQAWIRLNNLYLQVERGEKRMSITVSNELRTLVGQAYDRDETYIDGTPMSDWWAGEFLKLPHWNDF